MTIQDRTNQNKQCWSRIIELEAMIREAEGEIGDLHELIIENMVKITQTQTHPNSKR